MGKGISSFVGGELSFPKLGSVLVGLTRGGVKFFLKLTQPNWVFEVKCEFWLACRLELKWSQDKSIHEVFTCFVCVLITSLDCG